MTGEDYPTYCPYCGLHQTLVADGYDEGREQIACYNCGMRFHRTPEKIMKDEKARKKFEALLEIRQMLQKVVATSWHRMDENVLLEMRRISGSLNEIINEETTND